MSLASSQQQLLLPTYIEANRLLLLVLAVLFVISLGLSTWYNTWQAALVIGLPALIVPWLLHQSQPGGLASRCALACAFMFFSALMIHQAHGMIEMHFSVFVLLAFLLYYRDWLPVVVAAGVIAVHHLLFNWLQANGGAVYVFPQANFVIVLIHAAFVIFQSAFLVYMALKLRNQTLERQQIIELAHDIGQGNLQTSVQNANRQDLSGLQALLAMRGRLREVLDNVSQQAKHLTRLAPSLSEIAQQVAQGADTQHHAATDMTQAIETLHHNMASIADNVNKAKQVASTSGDISTTGGNVIREAVSEMQRIATTIRTTAQSIDELGQQSDTISGMVNVIKEVADQTNLLALNAAIEAARAGEQGRGFAVVADEVRKLAERTAHATDEIRSMIDNIQHSRDDVVSSAGHAVTQVNNGVNLAEQAGNTLDKMTTATREVVSVVDDIAQALGSQAQTAAAISQRVEAVGAASDQQTRVTRDAASMAKEISTLAQQLNTAISRFRNEQ